MALPKLNAVPKYDIVVPSTQQAVRFRPYLVKEEKVLMLAMESQDQKQSLNAIVDTIVACVSEDIERNKLTTFDVEYMFTQIRSKSVGETSKVSIKCKECDHSNEVVIPLESIKINMPDNIVTLIELTPEISVQLKWPTYSDLGNLDMSAGASQVKQTFEMISKCIDSVLTGDERISMKDEPKEEVMDFIESLTSEQFDKIREFVEQMPKLKHDVEFTCTSCSEANKITLEGMNDFF
jgi:hypothetical protein